VSGRAGPTGAGRRREPHTGHECERAKVVNPADHLALALALSCDPVAQVPEDEDAREDEDGELDCGMG